MTVHPLIVSMTATLSFDLRVLPQLMIAAGVNPKALSEFMGHATISITFDLYGHLMPGAREEAAGLLDAFLARAAEAETDATTAPGTAPQAAPHSAPAQV